MKLIDDFLNGITMYRLVFYYLLILLAWSIILSFFGFLGFSPVSLVFSAASIMVVCWVTNKIFATFLKATTNFESIFITSLILFFIITPASNFHDLPFLFWASVLASASKYILAINKKHIFNPAALAVTVTSLVGLGGASWWVGTASITPAVFLAGLLIVKKIRRWDLILSFLSVFLLITLLPAVLKGDDLFILVKQIFLDSSVLFFTTVMLAEPLTTPPAKVYRIIYGCLVGLLFTQQLNFGSFTTTPELALVLGNIFSYLVSPKDKLLLKLQQKIQLSPDTYDFVFGMEKKINFLPGQYMEWTLSQKKPDTRGSRRFFTLASSPTEDTLRIGVKFYPNGSSWKKALLEMPPGGEIVASQLAGEFTLPKDPTKRLVFIAGGIGVTPFRSIIKYLLDKRESRIMTLFYSVKTERDAVYMDLFNQAKEFGLKTIVNVSDKDGLLTAETIAKEAPDFKSSIFYISGPHGMVDGFKKTLLGLGISSGQIKTDYFPGYA